MSNKVYRTLLFWLVWASFALIVTLGLYVDTGIWEFIKSDTTKLTWVILALFVASMFVAFVLRSKHLPHIPQPHQDRKSVV